MECFSLHVRVAGAVQTPPRRGLYDGGRIPEGLRGAAAQDEDAERQAGRDRRARLVESRQGQGGHQVAHQCAQRRSVVWSHHLDSHCPRRCLL